MGVRVVLALISPGNATHPAGDIDIFSTSGPGA